MMAEIWLRIRATQVQNQAETAAFYVEIPGGNAGVKETLKIMRRIVREYRRNPLIVLTAQNITRNVPEKSWIGEIEAIHRFVRDNIRYMLDVNEVEVLQSPAHLLMTKQGDCDDKATLLATLLEATGHPARFVAVGFDQSNLTHVLVEARIGEDWIPLETTENVAPGWFPPNVNVNYTVHI
jgi:transglutaminase-like putative cysteine protease